MTIIIIMSTSHVSHCQLVDWCAGIIKHIHWMFTGCEQSCIILRSLFVVDSAPIFNMVRVVEPAVLVNAFENTPLFLCLMSIGCMSHCQLMHWCAVTITHVFEQEWLSIIFRDVFYGGSIPI